MFLNDWENIDEMKNDFEISDVELAGVRILLASYTCENYDGSAFVLFERDGKLYEVNGNHCSCYGLEGQWEPEETTVESLRHRLEKGWLGWAWDGTANTFADEFANVLNTIERR